MPSQRNKKYISNLEIPVEYLELLFEANNIAIDCGGYDEKKRCFNFILRKVDQDKSCRLFGVETIITEVAPGMELRNIHSAKLWDFIEYKIKIEKQYETLSI
jgi:hypothetical protein